MRKKQNKNRDGGGRIEEGKSRLAKRPVARKPVPHDYLPTQHNRRDVVHSRPATASGTALSQELVR